MSSSLIIPLVKAEKVFKHPSADSLDVIHFGGWQVVHSKDLIKEGEDLVFFLPIVLLGENALKN